MRKLLNALKSAWLVSSTQALCLLPNSVGAALETIQIDLKGWVGFPGGTSNRCTSTLDTCMFSTWTYRDTDLGLIGLTRVLHQPSWKMEIKIDNSAKGWKKSIKISNYSKGFINTHTKLTSHPGLSGVCFFMFMSISVLLLIAPETRCQNWM